MLEIYKKLYENINEWLTLEYYKHCADVVPIKLTVNNMDYYVSVLGQSEKVIGLNIYKGSSGYRDLMSLNEFVLDDEEVSLYLMNSISCLTLYIDPIEEIELDQAEMIRKLNIPSYKGVYPHILSFKERYFQIGADQDEIKEFAQVFEVVLKVFKNNPMYDLSETIMDKKERLLIQIDEKNIATIQPLPDYISKYAPYHIEDEALINRLSLLKTNNDILIVHLAYIPIQLDDPTFLRPVNALLFIIYNKTKDQMVYMDLIGPQYDTKKFVLNSFIEEYINKNGIPQYIIYANPHVEAAIDELCEIFSIIMLFDQYYETTQLVNGICELINADQEGLEDYEII